MGQRARAVVPLVVGAGGLFAAGLTVELLVDPPGVLGPALAASEVVLLVGWVVTGLLRGSDRLGELGARAGTVERDGAELRLRFDGPEISSLRVTIASIGERVIALGIDLTAVGVVYLALARAFDYPAMDWVLLVVVGLALRHAYFVGFEALWHGATPGKRLMGLRAMASDGRALDIRSLVVRNVLRDAEIIGVILLCRLVGNASHDEALPEQWPLVVAVVAGVLIVPLLSKGRQRLGDLVADTVVIRMPKMPRIPEDTLLPPCTEVAFSREQLGIYGTKELRSLEELLDGLVAGNGDSYEVATEVAGVIAGRIGIDPAKVPDAERFLRSFYRAQRARLERDHLRGLGEDQPSGSNSSQATSMRPTACSKKAL